MFRKGGDLNQWSKPLKMSDVDRENTSSPVNQCRRHQIGVVNLLTCAVEFLDQGLEPIKDGCSLIQEHQSLLKLRDVSQSFLNAQCQAIDLHRSGRDDQIFP